MALNQAQYTLIVTAVTARVWLSPQDGRGADCLYDR